MTNTCNTRLSNIKTLKEKVIDLQKQLSRLQNIEKIESLSPQNINRSHRSPTPPKC
jgi:hypothetical protein